MMTAQLESAFRRLDQRGAGAAPLFDACATDAAALAEAQLRKRLGEDVPITALYAEDGGYPEALSALGVKDAPEGLIAAGNLALLEEPLLGICGSRAASELGLGVAADLCGELARKGAVIVSGYASGVDETAHRAALEAGGATVCVLAEGLTHFRLRRSLRDAWDWRRALVISQFGLNAIWRAGRAMQRNKTLVALSAATVVVEARDTGGTLDAGLTALRLGKPLFVADYGGERPESAGNRLLLQHGGAPFGRRRGGGVALAGVAAALFGTG